MKETIILAIILLSASVAVGTVSSLIVMEFREPVVVVLDGSNNTVEKHTHTVEKILTIETPRYVPHEKSKACQGKHLGRMTEWTVPEGVSMLPSLYAGDKILTTPYEYGNKYKDVVPGDIIFADTMHRVTAVYEDYVITQGDNNLYDEEVSKQKITDVVCATLRT